MWPTYSVSFWIACAVVVSSFGSPVCVTKTGARLLTPHVWPAASTFAPAVCSPIASRSYAEKLSRTWRMVVPVGQTPAGNAPAPDDVVHEKRFVSLSYVGFCAGCWAARPYTTLEEPGTTNSPLGNFARIVKLEVSEH